MAVNQSEYMDNLMIAFMLVEVVGMVGLYLYFTFENKRMRKEWLEENG